MNFDSFLNIFGVKWANFDKKHQFFGVFVFCWEMAMRLRALRQEEEEKENKVGSFLDPTFYF